MSAISFARVSGLAYRHTTFGRIAHADRPLQEWVARWEDFFNLGAGELPCDDSRLEVVNYSRHFRDLWMCFGWQGRERELFRRYGVMLAEFTRRYYRNKIPRHAGQFTVAVHVRRGDALPDNRDYYTDDAAIRRTITEVQSLLEALGVGYRLRLYSEGDRNDFRGLELPGVEFFLDADPFWTLRELVEADVLIMAKGCYSHYAALISDGVKIGPRQTLVDWYMPPREHWVECLPDGSFDAAAFVRGLAATQSVQANGRLVLS